MAKAQRQGKDEFSQNQQINCTYVYLRFSFVYFQIKENKANIFITKKPKFFIIIVWEAIHWIGLGFENKYFL